MYYILAALKTEFPINFLILLKIEFKSYLYKNLSSKRGEGQTVVFK